MNSFSVLLSSARAFSAIAEIRIEMISYLGIQMKLVHVLTVLSLAVFGLNTQAEEDFAPHWYGDIHMGNTTTSMQQAPQDFTFLSIGGTIGYAVNPNFGWEFIGSFATNGKDDALVSPNLNVDAKARYDAMGFYFMGKTSGQFYVKGRVGLGISTFSYSASGYEDEAKRTVGFAYGVGAGVQLEKVYLELNYNAFPEAKNPFFSELKYDADQLVFSVGAQF